MKLIKLKASSFVLMQLQMFMASCSWFMASFLLIAEERRKDLAF